MMKCRHVLILVFRSLHAYAAAVGSTNQMLFAGVIGLVQIVARTVL